MLTLAPIVTNFQQTIERIDETSNLSVTELEELGVPEDMHEKIREIGAQSISMTKEKLEIDLHWLKEIADDQKYIPKLAVPQEKFAQFLIEDFEEGLAYIRERKWFYDCLGPDPQRQLKKFDTHLKAQMAKRTRLLKAYKRYIPTQSEKLQNLIAKKEAQLKAVQQRIDTLQAEADRLQKDRLEKEAIIASLTAAQASQSSDSSSSNDL